jgi:hypothetical protein
MDNTFSIATCCDLADKIKSVDHTYECVINRALIYLKNGYQISVIKGFGTYSDDSTVEIAVFDLDGEFCYLPDNVEGYVTPERLLEVINEVSLFWGGN